MGPSLRSVSCCPTRTRLWAAARGEEARACVLNLDLELSTRRQAAVGRKLLAMQAQAAHLWGKRVLHGRHTPSTPCFLLTRAPSPPRPPCELLPSPCQARCHLLPDALQASWLRPACSAPASSGPQWPLCLANGTGGEGGDGGREEWLCPYCVHVAQLSPAAGHVGNWKCQLSPPSPASSAEVPHSPHFPMSKPRQRDIQAM